VIPLRVALLSWKVRHSIAWGIATALADRPMAECLGRNGRKEVEAHFAWDRIVEETEQVYASL
jgi:glycosyltransferase involved in cell wall biosynthesis